MQYFDELLLRGLSYWPEEIHIRQRDVLPGASYLTKSSDLNNIHDEIEDKIAELNDFPLGVIDWAIFTVAHAAATYIDVVRPAELSKSAILNKFESDINHDGEDSTGLYEQLRAAHNKS